MNFKINENSCFCGHEFMSQLITNVRHVILNFWRMYKAKIKFQKKKLHCPNERVFKQAFYYKLYF